VLDLVLLRRAIRLDVTMKAHECIGQLRRFTVVEAEILGKRFATELEDLRVQPNWLDLGPRITGVPQLAPRGSIEQVIDLSLLARAFERRKPLEPFRQLYTGRKTLVDIGAPLPRGRDRVTAP